MNSNERIYIINCSIFMFNTALSLIIFDEKRVGVGTLFLNILFVLSREYIGKSDTLHRLFQLVEELVIAVCLTLLALTSFLVIFNDKNNVFNLNCETLLKIKIDLIAITFLLHTSYMIFISPYRLSK